MILVANQNEQAVFLHLLFYNSHVCLSPSLDLIFYAQLVCFWGIK